MDRRSMGVVGDPVRVTCNGRRYFSKAHKEAVVAKCLAPGASLAAVALANGFNANLVRKWVRQRQRLPKSGVKLLPVVVEPERGRAMGEGPLAGAARAGEGGAIELRVGRVELVVRGRVDCDQLAVVLATLVRAR